MTPEEAIVKLEVYSSTNGSGQCTDEEHLEAKRIAVKALEKQIPKKLSGVEWYSCPVCNQKYLGRTEKHCRNCGQALYWNKIDKE